MMHCLVISAIILCSLYPPRSSALRQWSTTHSTPNYSFQSTPSPFEAASPPRVRPIPLPYPPLSPYLVQEHHIKEPEALHPDPAALEWALDAFFKLAHSRILTNGRASDIRALATGLFPSYVQLCAQLGDDVCDSAVGELFRARYNEMQIELDRMDRMHIVLTRLMRARGRWGRKKMKPGSRITDGKKHWRRVRKGGRWFQDDED